MKKFYSNYKQSLLLIGSMLIGLLLGFIFKDKILFLNPLGNLFVNLLSTIIVPLVFTSIVLSTAKINPKNYVNSIKKMFKVFIFYLFIASIFGIIFTKLFPVLKNTGNILLDNSVTSEKISILESITSMVSTTDFVGLLSKNNMIPLILFSILFGISIQKLNNKETIIELTQNINDIIMNILTIIMKYAPIGIMSFVAVQVSTLGSSIAIGYIRVFILYFIASIIFMFLFYSIICIKTKRNIFTFWKESLPVILCSLSTCSSASCIPVNINSLKKLEVDDNIASSSIFLGTSFHKDGSVIDSVFKIMFLLILFDRNASITNILIASVLSSLLVSAIPIGGGTIAEMFILSYFNFPINALPILTIIATITDAPATMLNALGNTNSALLIDYKIKKDANL